MPLLDKNSTDSDAKPKTPAKATPTKTPRRNKKLPNTKENNQTLLTGFFKTKVASAPSKTNEAIAENEVNTPSKPSTMKEETTTNDKETTAKTSTSPVTRSQTAVSNEIGSHTQADTSPVSKPKAKASPKVTNTNETSPTTRSMTKALPASSVTKESATKSPVTRSQTVISPTVTSSSKAAPKSATPKKKNTSKSSLKVAQSPKSKNSSSNSVETASVSSVKDTTKAVTPKLKPGTSVSASALPKHTPVTTNEIITRSPPKKLKTVSTSEMATGCDLDQEARDIEDKVFLKTLKLSKEQLKLKESNPELFWEQAAEAKRVELEEYLIDNKQVKLIDMVIILL